MIPEKDERQKEALSPDRADDLLAALDDDPEEDIEDQTQEPAKEAEADDNDFSPEELEASDDGEEDSPENEELTDTYADRSHKVRMDDGTVLSVDDLVKGNLFQSDYTRKTTELANQRREFEDRNQRVEQLETELGQQRDLVISVLSQMLPPEPDVNLSLSDPMAYTQQRAAFDAAMRNIQTLQEQHVEAQNRRTQDDQGRQEQFRREQRDIILAHNPELADVQKWNGWMNDNVQYAQKYGFSRDEVLQTEHAGLLLMLEDATKWQKLQSQRKPARKKAEKKPPVRQGGTRNRTTSQKHSAFQRGKEKLRNTGDRNIADALLSQFD